MRLYIGMKENNVSFCCNTLLTNHIEVQAGNGSATIILQPEHNSTTVFSHTSRTQTTDLEMSICI